MPCKSIFFQHITCNVPLYIMWIFWLNLFTLNSLNSSRYLSVCYKPHSRLESVSTSSCCYCWREWVGKKFRNMCQLYTFSIPKKILHPRQKKSVCMLQWGRGMMVNKLWCKFSCLLNFIFFDEGSLQLLLDFQLKFSIYFFLFYYESHNHFTSRKKSYFKIIMQFSGKKGARKLAKTSLTLFVCWIACCWSVAGIKNLTHFSSTNFSHHTWRGILSGGVRKYFSHLSGFALNKRRRQRQWRVRLMGFM